MQLAARELGIGSCFATIYEREDARLLLGYPDDQHLHVAISFGFPADPAVLIARPRRGGRRAFDAVAHWERWSQSPAV